MPHPDRGGQSTGVVEAELARRDLVYYAQQAVESARREYRWAWRVLVRATSALVASLQVELLCGNAARRYFAAGRGERVYGTPESEAVQGRRHTREAALSHARLCSETRDAFAYYRALADIEETAGGQRRRILTSTPPADRIEGEGWEFASTGGYW